jgi:hypothetical protein
MDTETIAVVAAGIGVVATVVYLALGFAGIRTLRDIRDGIRRRRADTRHDERR